MLTIDETRALSEINTEFKKVLNSGSPFLASCNLDTNIHELRDGIKKAKEGLPEPDLAALPYIQEEIEIPVRHHRKVAARIYKPRDVSPDGYPGFIVFHGGGYALGDFDTEAWLCELFTQLGGIAVNIDYRHAPEHVFPAAIDDAFDATKWTAENAKLLDINPAKGLLIGGESSGADICLVVSHLCQEVNMSPSLTGIYASMPGGVNEETVPEKYREHFFSMEQNVSAPVLSAASVEFFRKNYQVDAKSPLAFPLAFPSHEGLPKTYFQVCGLDPTRDSGLVMERVFKDAGVMTKLDIYPGVPHAFWALFSELSLSRKHAQDAREGLTWLLAK